MKKIINTSILAISSAFIAHGAVISVPDYTLVPDGTNFGSDGSNTSTEISYIDVNTLNGGNNVHPQVADGVIYLITTFNFGANSDAHLQTNFAISTGPDRFGLLIEDDGKVYSTGVSDNSVRHDLAQDMAGQSVTVMIKADYNSSHSDDFGFGSNGRDSVFTYWVNPTASSTEFGVTELGSGDFTSVWNSQNFPVLEQRILNQSTPGTAGDSSITDTVILTDSNATFANALAIAAPVPEPSSTALLGLGGLALILRRRK